MQGLVLKSTGSWYEVRSKDGQLWKGRIKGKLRLAGIKSTNPVAVGDWVKLDVSGVDEALITDIEERKNHIVRRSVNLSKQTQVIAANLDQALLIVTLSDPPTHQRFIDRFAVTAEAYSVPLVLVFNKIDAYSEEERAHLEYLEIVYQDAGYTTLATSAYDKRGLAELKNLIKDKISLLSGHSGVGKSTLINKIEPTLNLKTRSISETHRQGQHTTTFAEMHPLSFGGYVIDTPGIKGFGLVDMSTPEIGDYFPEIFRLKEQCKFNNCLHIHEPGCAVLAALEAGELPFERYESYLSFAEGDENEIFREDDHRP